MAMNTEAQKKNRKYKKSTRFRQITGVFIEYNVIQNLVKQTHPEKIRTAFEELGSTFIKIGQMLSVRTDIFPPSFIDELKKLQDNVKKDDYPIIKEIIETEAQQPIKELFSSFEEVPFASASMGQTHKAVLPEGQIVAVKIQHAGIREEIGMDLSLLEKALPLIKYIPESKIIDLKNIFQEIKQSLEKELDGIQEAANGKYFYELNNNWSIIQVPKIYQEYCTPRVLVMEYIEGASIRSFFGNQQQSDPANQKLREEFGNILVRNYIKQVFEDGFFHADPHPGNIFVQAADEKVNEEFGAEKNKANYFEKKFKYKTIDFLYQREDMQLPYRLIYLDFGMMGQLKDKMLNKLTDIMVSLYRNNTRVTGQAILQVCKKVGPLDEEHFYEQLTPLLERNYGVGIGELNLQSLFFQIVAICHENNLQIPQEVTMLIKSVITFEGMIRELAPEISLVEISAPFARKYFTEKIDWSTEFKRTILDALYSAKAVPQIPSRTLDVLDDLSKGKAKVNIELKKQDELLNKVEVMVNRLVIGLILSSLIIGSSMLVEFNGTMTRRFVSILGIFGYGIALFSILFLIYDIWRKYRKK
ncbi:AarF/ABC1/UbiB kinase family protein [Enterococcus sp. BWB1-3]|uniref:ABC1 kinase family protein n=1 Tax=unclassified Enterococcus TaxID=2608891 RepID=UPI001923737E|nr:MULTISPECIES: AarF/UbiB family protein [unclassified Enterococcus]MBL1228408.1 AarF/ABC1/UbiB kinase family protein [Enterococcus sp. BWB1-3]MCB5951223.1 AarF/ABC1/UbiB kinase family protein [Enterococcus sp. BWT-B8]